MTIAQSIPVADTWMHGGWGWGWMTLMLLMMLLFWGAIIATIVWLIRGTALGRSASEKPASSETPTAILDRRFAEGDIDEEDYRARMRALDDVGS